MVFFFSGKVFRDLRGGLILVDGLIKGPGCLNGGGVVLIVLTTRLPKCPKVRATTALQTAK